MMQGYYNAKKKMEGRKKLLEKNRENTSSISRVRHRQELSGTEVAPRVGRWDYMKIKYFYTTKETTAWRDSHGCGKNLPDIFQVYYNTCTIYGIA